MNVFILSLKHEVPPSLFVTKFSSQSNLMRKKVFKAIDLCDIFVALIL